MSIGFFPLITCFFLNNSTFRQLHSILYFSQMLYLAPYRTSEGIVGKKKAGFSPVLQNLLSLIAFFLFFSGNAVIGQTANLYYITTSRLTFTSKAPLETITATSEKMKGVLDLFSRSVAFSVHNQSFFGFNSPLQKDHFHENYIESEKYPDCTFSGKIIDEFDAKTDGSYPVRVKGVLNIKGIGIERIVKGTLNVKGDEIWITATFFVALSDHEIRIPRIVQQKIAPEIEISLQARLRKEAAK